MSRMMSFNLFVAIAAAISTGCSGGATQSPVQSGDNQTSNFSQPNAGVVSIEKELGSGSPLYFEVLGLGSPTNVSITGPSGVFGFHDVGVAGTSQFSMSDGVIQRRLVLTSTDTTNISGPSKIRGGIVVDNALLAAAATDAINASGYYAGLAASPGTPTNINITNPSGDMTINAVAPTTVIVLQDLILNGGSTVTLSAPKPGWQFIVNVKGRLVLEGGSSVLASGIDSPHVLFNVLGNGQDVAMGGGTHNGVPTSRLMGVLLAPQRNIALSPGLVQPEVIGGGQQITITSGGEVENRDE